MSGPTHLAVGLLKKPHGLQGEVIIYPLTDAPEQVFKPGRVLAVLDKQGRPTGGSLVLKRGRAYHRAWLLKFEGIDDRNGLGVLRDRYLGIDVGEARPLGEGEFYLHELIGLRVELRDKTSVGVVKDVFEAPQGYLLGVEAAGGGRQHLLPFNPDIVRRVDRAEKLIVVTPPPGLLEL